MTSQGTGAFGTQICQPDPHHPFPATLHSCHDLHSQRANQTPSAMLEVGREVTWDGRLKGPRGLQALPTLAV